MTEQLRPTESLSTTQALGIMIEAFYLMTQGKLTREEYAKLRFNTMIQVNQNRQKGAK
jgi:hypothetical protein